VVAEGGGVLDDLLHGGMLHGRGDDVPSLVLVLQRIALEIKNEERERREEKQRNTHGGCWMDA
jgi:hypothetical protein